jgi:hypothetical protein
MVPDKLFTVAIWTGRNAFDLRFQYQRLLNEFMLRDYTLSLPMVSVIISAWEAKHIAIGFSAWDPPNETSYRLAENMQDIFGRRR